MGMLPPSDEPAPPERGMPDAMFQCAHYTTFFLLCKGKIPRAFLPGFFLPGGQMPRRRGFRRKSPAAH